MHLSAFFSEILFFWKLVSHGGLDFTIFVSSTIWNQCFRSKNCSTAEGRLWRNNGTQDRLSPAAAWAHSRSWGKTNSKICSWVFFGFSGVIVGRRLCSKYMQWLKQGQEGVSLFLWHHYIGGPLGMFLHCSSCNGVLGRSEGSDPGGLLHLHQHCLPAPGRCLEYSVWLPPALRYRSEEHHWPISYTGWPISPGVQSLFLSSTIWNRLWCRGKSTSLKASWCLVISSLLFPRPAEQRWTVTVSLLTS